MSNDSLSKLKQIIEKIASENDLKTTEIKYGSGSTSGEGFMSNNIAVDIKDGDKSLHLFCKTHLQATWTQTKAVDNMFSNEMHFYKTIYPAYQEFLTEKDVKNGFKSVPKSFAIDKDIIILENLKQRGFDLFNKQEIMNDNHIILTMKTLAKFHAISFAFKDQKNDLYNSFTQNIHNCFTDMILQAKFNETLAADMRAFVRSLDPVEDKHILDGSGDLVKNLVDTILNIDEYPSRNRVIIHGDSWCNNMMYLYDGENRESPAELMVLDWQIMRKGSPAIDLSYFFYSIATESALQNLEYYLKAYHDELSRGIKELGSNPELLYPYEALKEDWKNLAKYSFGLEFFVVKTLLADKEDLLKFEEFPDLRAELEKQGEVNIDNIMVRIKKEDEYFSRMKAILKHFIENNFL